MTITAESLRVEVVPLASLRPHPRNYRTHPEAQLAHLEASLRQHGWYRNLVIAQDGTILAGHGIAQAAERLGWTEAPVHRMPVGPDDPAALKVLAADNELSRLAEDDGGLLAGILQEVQSLDLSGLLGTGYDEVSLAALLTATAPAQPPDGFPAFDEDLATEHTCPKCGYEWSGAS